MSVLGDIVNAPMRITGEMWFCADTQQPTKIVAGRGAKQLVCVVDNCFIVYGSPTTQAKVVAAVRFRGMRRATRITHHPKPTTTGMEAPRRITAKEPPKTVYSSPRPRSGVRSRRGGQSRPRQVRTHHSVHG
jgi:hypothetical protein